MQKFADFVKLQEISAMSLGQDVLGGATGTSMDPKAREAFDAVVKAFELVLGAKPGMVTSWLQRTSDSIPEVKDQVSQMLSQIDVDSLNQLKSGAGRAGQKIGNSISKGLGDMSNTNHDVVSMNAADTFKGEAYLVETAAVCARCGKDGRASEYDINAGKAKCRECGGTMHKAEKKSRSSK